MTLSEQLAALTHGATQLHSRDELERKLAKGHSLRVKLGLDPSSPDLHIGHALVLDRIRLFQDLGHIAVLIIGDYTARIGDPTGRSKTRPALDPADVERNAATYKEQAFKILDPSRCEVHRNSDWFDKMSYADVLRLNARMTVARLMERQDFRSRFEKGLPISLSEFQYPLMQGYDSVMIRADVELGGNDQLFNNMVGRDLQSQEGVEPQVVIVLPILTGTDGVQKMSKSLGNSIGLTEAPSEMFGKVLSISDETMEEWLPMLASSYPLTSPRPEHPMERKLDLARAIVERFHGAALAQQALAKWHHQFSEKQAPEEMPSYVLVPDQPLYELLKSSGVVPTGSEGRRLVRQGGVSLDGAKLTDEHLVLTSPGVLKCGKRRFVRLLPAS